MVSVKSIAKKQPRSKLSKGSVTRITLFHNSKVYIILEVKQKTSLVTLDLTAISNHYISWTATFVVKMSAKKFASKVCEDEGRVPLQCGQNIY